MCYKVPFLGMSLAQGAWEALAVGLLSLERGGWPPGLDLQALAMGRQLTPPKLLWSAEWVGPMPVHEGTRLVSPLSQPIPWGRCHQRPSFPVTFPPPSFILSTCMSNQGGLQVAQWRQSFCFPWPCRLCACTLSPTWEEELSRARAPGRGESAGSQDGL